MSWIWQNLGEGLTILVIAVAVGMDAFSLGLGVGMQRLRCSTRLGFSLLVGALHVLTPLMGLLAGHWLNDQMGRLAIWLGGLILLGLGMQMMFSGLFEREEQEKFLAGGWGMLALAFGVSVDSLSVGLTMGLFSASVLASLLAFGFFGFALSWAGLSLGHAVSGRLGKMGEVVGGLILVAFGVKFLL